MFPRRFFILVLTLNFIGLGLAIAGSWPYAKKYQSAFVLGNLNFAILMRNEVFGRILYLFVNTCFAKVCPFVSHVLLYNAGISSQWTPLWWRLACTSTLQVR